MGDQNQTAKIEARIDALSVLLCTVVKASGMGQNQVFMSALDGNMRSAEDLALLTTYPEAYLEELRAFSSHLRERISK